MKILQILRRFVRSSRRMRMTALVHPSVPANSMSRNRTRATGHLLALAFLVIPAPASAAPANGNYAAGRLESGIRYIIVPSELHGDKIKLGMRVFAGRFYEQADEFGAAHLVEHLLASYYTNEKGVRTSLFDHPVIALNSPNSRKATTGQVATKYEFEVGKDNLSAGLEILRGMAHGAKFSDAEIRIQHGVVIAEHSRPMENSEGDGALQKMEQEMRFPGIHEPSNADAVRKALMRLRAREVREFYDKWYRPGNEIIYVAGDVDLGQAESLIQNIFSDLPRLALPEPPHFSPQLRKYLYYQSRTDRYSKVRLQFSIGTGPHDTAAFRSNLANDAFECIRNRIDNSSKKTAQLISISKENGRSVVLPFGFEVTVIAEPALMPSALIEAANHVSFCKADVSEGLSGSSFKDAVETVANSTEPYYDDLYTSLIKNSAAYDEPLLRNGLIDLEVSMGIGSTETHTRKEFIDSLFSVRDMVVIGFDPAGAPSVLSSEEEVRHIMEQRSASTERGRNSEAQGKSTQASYALGRALKGALGNGANSIDKLISDRASVDGQAAVVVRSAKGYLDLPRDLMKDGRGLSEFLVKVEPFTRGEDVAPASPRVKIRINPTNSYYTISLNPRQSSKIDDELDKVQILDDEVKHHGLSIVATSGKMAYNNGDIDQQIVENYLRSGRVAQCPGVKERSYGIDPAAYDKIIAYIFDEQSTTVAVERVSEVNGGIGLSRVEDKQGRSEGPFREVSYGCELGTSEIGSAYIAVKPQGDLPDYSKTEMLLAGNILQDRMMRRLREREAGTYSPVAYLIQDRSVFLLKFSSIFNKIPQLRAAALEEFRALAEKGVSHREIAQACYSMEGCTGNENAKVISGLFSKLKGAPISSFTFRH